MVKGQDTNIAKYIGLLFIVASAFLFFYKQYETDKLDKQEELKIKEFFEEETDTTSLSDVSEIKEIATNTNYFNNYTAVIEIPKINLKRGLVSITSKYNNVNYNIEIINSSTMPNVKNGNLILASHNGASNVSFFKNLHKLNINDKVYVYYKGVKYEYLINKYYDTDKDGNIEIYRDQNKTTITLITCKYNTKDKQIVYIGYLNSEVSY